MNCSQLTASPVSTSSAYYGSGIQFDSLSNVQVSSLDADYRFRASSSAAVASVMWYSTSGRNDGSCNGYGCGTGGSIQFCIYADDDTSEHLWDPNKPLACLAEPNLRSLGGLRTDSFSPSPQLVAGSLYHLHWRNVDASPAVNYTSVNSTFVWHATSPRQPTIPDTDLAVISGNSVLPQFSPIFQINYSDSSLQGSGYTESWILAPVDISGTSTVRERFTVSTANRTINSVAVRLNRSSGSGALVVTLATLGGQQLASCSMSADTFPQQALSGDSSTNHPVWGNCAFSQDISLILGQSYQLLLSTDAKTHYQEYAIHKGSTYDFMPPTFFRDGYSQFSIDDGNTWKGFTQPGGATNNLDADIQFYFIGS